MKKIGKKTISIISLLFILAFFTAPISRVLAEPPKPVFKYNLLAPLPCAGDPKTTDCIDTLSTFDPTQPNSLGKYLNIAINLFIGISAVLAVIMIVLGGIEYMTSETLHTKEHGRERIRNAIFGLLLALGAYLILYTINPNILNTGLESVKEARVEIQPNSIYNKPIIPQNTARCTPLTSGPCAIGNLNNTFDGKSEAMSKICNVESAGNASAQSGSDKGTDGTIFSFGLFQINLLANGSYIKDSSGNSCADLFVRGSDGSPIIGTNYIKKDSSGRFFYDAKLKSGMEGKYNACKTTLFDPTKNIQLAGVLFKKAGTAPWKGDQGVCPSAFN